MTEFAAIEASLRRAASFGAAAALAVFFATRPIPAAAAGSAEAEDTASLMSRMTAAIAAVFGSPVPGSAAGSAEPQDAASLLSRAANAARSLNFVGTLVYQHAGRVETSRLVHWNDAGAEYEKLVNLEGPVREVIRSANEARCYYPEAKVVRIEPRTFRNAFPALSAQQQKALTDYYELRRAEPDRVAGLDAQAWIFEPRDGLRYGQKLWFERSTGLLLKARIQNERNEPVEQFTFTDIAIGARVDREMVRPSWPPAPPAWQIQTGPGETESAETGWVVRGAPPGFSRVAEGYRTARGKRAPVAHIVYSDGLVAVSVFVEPAASVHPAGLLQQGGVNVFIRDVDGYMVTALGEAPAATIRQIANSVARR